MKLCCSPVVTFAILSGVALVGFGCSKADSGTTSVSKSVLDFEEVASALGISAKYAVSDATRDAFLASAPPRIAELVESGGGVAAGDVDGDSDVDLIVLRGDKPPGVYLNQLTQQANDPGFEAVTGDLGLTLDAWAQSPVLVDLVGDAKPDLLVAGLGERRLTLFENHWPAPFEDVTEQVGLTATLPTFGFAVGDVDNDGDLDVFVGRYGNVLDLEPQTALTELLWRNDGKGKFVDVSDALGAAPSSAVAGALTEGTLAPNFVDVDSDGDLDLVLTGERGYTTVLRNGLVASEFNFAEGAQPAGARDAGTVGDAGVASVGDASASDAAAGDAALSADAGVKAVGVLAFESLPLPASLAAIGGRGSAFADLDNDGNFDWFVSGGASGKGDSLGSKLFTNSGKSLTEMGAAAGLDGRGFGLGACAEDFNNDGMTDLFQVADSSYLGGAASEGASSIESAAALYVADLSHPGQWDEAATSVGLNRIARGRAALCFDYDKDGDIDIFVTAVGKPLQVYRNKLNPVDGSGANYFGLRLLYTGANSAGVGAKVSVRIGGVTQVRHIRHANGLFGQGPTTAQFGLGAEPYISELRVIWPNGVSTPEAALDVNDWVRIGYRAVD